MYSIRTPRFSIAFVVLFASSLSLAAHAGTVSFSAVRNSSLPLDQFQAESYTYTMSDLRTDATVASVSIPTGNARSQTLLGTNRVAVESLSLVDDQFLRQNSIGGPFSVSISAWTDRFTITGGVGVGTAQVRTSVNGQFGPKPDPSFGGSGAYYLFIADENQIASLFAKPFEFIVNRDLSGAILQIQQNVLTPGFTDPGESLPPGSPFGRNLLGSLAFTYDTPFYLVSILAGYANDFGILESFNSANFGITSPSNSLITTQSGFTYASAVPVPEPSAGTLLAIGAVALLAMRCLKGQRRTEG